jgi:hypothetical protein
MNHAATNLKTKKGQTQIPLNYFEPQNQLFFNYLNFKSLNFKSLNYKLAFVALFFAVTTTTTANATYYKTCDSLSTQQTIVPEKATVTIHPSPFKSEFSVSVSHSSIESVEIYDTFGKLVKQHTTGKKISTSNMPNGTYVLKVHLSNGEIVTEKLLKEKNNL